MKSGEYKDKKPPKSNEESKGNNIPQSNSVQNQFINFKEKHVGKTN